MVNISLASSIIASQELGCPLILDKSKSNTNSQAISIDDALDNVQCFQISSFNYIVGNCLFDTIQVFLYCQYTCAELHNGLVNYFPQFL